MGLWWIFLLSYLSIGFAQKNCGRPRVDYSAPEFFSAKNLSIDECGIWKPMLDFYVPWQVNIWKQGGACGGVLISQSSVLTYDCDIADEFANSENTDDWKARLGQCAISVDADCDAWIKGGQILKIKSVTKLNAPGNPRPIHIWRIKKTPLNTYRILPICISNLGNLQYFNSTYQYRVLSQWHGESPPTTLSEDFGPCLNQSEKYKTCDKVHKNFLCVRTSTREYWKPFLVHRDEDHRYSLRALVVEDIFGKDLFYYDLYPLLGQIASASGDIQMMPKIPKARRKTVDFGINQSFPGCGTLDSNRRKKRNTSTDDDDDDDDEDDEDYEDEDEDDDDNGKGDDADVPVNKSTEAERHQQPWHVALVNKRDRSLFCGATLISPTALVTAAHCVVQKDGSTRNPSGMVVIAGLHNLTEISNFQNLGSRQELKPVRIFAHKNFSQDNLDNDVAVILVKGKGFNVTSSVRPICLWNEVRDFKHIEGTTGKVVGWGFDEKQTRPDVLQTTNLQVKNYKDCFMKDRNFFTKYLKPGRNFCAARNESTACGGDSGGGFAIEKDGKWFLRGVVSSENNQLNEKTNVTVCKPKLPTLYADVANYMDWIVQKARLQVTKKLKD